MTTYGEIMHMCNDLLKNSSDDSFFTLDHIKFLANKYRAYILKQEYLNQKKEIPQSNYQTICLDLEEVSSVDGIPCEDGYMLRTVQEIPSMFTFSTPHITTSSQFYRPLTYVSPERFSVVGYNRYLQNVLYATRGDDKHLYIRSFNPQFLHLTNLKMTGLFEDPEEAAYLACEENQECDIENMRFPLEDNFINALVQGIVSLLSGSLMSPQDNQNNANDDLSNLYSYIQRMTKKN